MAARPSTPSCPPRNCPPKRRATATPKTWRSSPSPPACALQPRAGLTAHDPQEAALKRAMIDGAALRVLLTDATKLDVVAPCAVARLDELDRVISDGAPPWLAAATAVETV